MLCRWSEEEVKRGNLVKKIVFSPKTLQRRGCRERGQSWWTDGLVAEDQVDSPEKHVWQLAEVLLLNSKLTCSVKLFLSRCHLKLNLSSIGTETLKNLLRVRLALMKGRSVGEDESMAMLVNSSPSSSSILDVTLKSEIYTKIKQCTNCQWLDPCLRNP